MKHANSSRLSAVFDALFIALLFIVAGAATGIFIGATAAFGFATFHILMAMFL